ncbi:hypothetical protein CcaverHIS641_0509140 [Cutaneotrichosporon cavernicola]|nr:hypothetical protein CcaverHIS641_0509140 [Cutaneotrichosporon cavernicola]
MARLDPINPEPPRQRKGKQGKGGDPKPSIRPSEVTAGGKPLVDLDADDLRAAGVTFTEGDMEDLPVPVVVDPSPEDEAEDDRTPQERAVEAWWDEFFDSMVYTIPFSFLFLLLDIPWRARLLQCAGRLIKLTSANRHIGTSKLCLFLTTAASIAASMRVIWLINRASYLRVMEQGPACGTIWIATIVMLPLGRALLALVVWYGGPVPCLLNSPPGRLRSGSSSTSSGPSWLRTADMGHPLVRLAPKRPRRRPSTPPRTELPPSSPWRTSPYSGSREENVLVSGRPTLMGRYHRDTPDPRSSSTLLYRIKFDDCDGDTLREPEDEMDEMEVARSRASPAWSPLENPFIVSPSLNSQNLLHGGQKLQEPEDLLQFPSPPLPRPPSLSSIPTRSYPKDEGWQEIKELINRARGRVSRQRGPPHDRWGFAMTRGMTIGYNPYQYNGNPSSDERKMRRRRFRSASPVEFSPTPPPRESGTSSVERYASSPQIPAGFTPAPPLPRAPAWRGRQLYEVLQGAAQHWQVPGQLREEASDNDDSEEVNKRKHEADKGKPSPHLSDVRQLSPASLAAREARIRHFNDVDTYQLHVEHVLG